MSVGGLIGGVVGGIVGFFIGGPAGAFYGASIGFSLGLAIDPITPDVPVAGMPLPAGSQVMLSEVGGPVPDLVGTGQIAGHLLCFGNERTETIYTEVGGGKGGGSPDPFISGYKYYMSWAVGIVAGPIDRLYTIYRNEDVVWEGELVLPVSGGQETIIIEEMGSAIFYFGTADQVANLDVGELIGDETLNSPYRHFCWCFFDDCYVGEYNRCPTMKFVLGKYPVMTFSADNIIQTYDYNPMHAIWYILHDLAGLPEAWLHTADFTSAAATLTTETRGICCLFMQQQNTLDYLESINNHIDGIIRYGSDGKFHPKLIREDYVIDDLSVIDEDVMLEDPTLNRKSWIDTVNEMRVQYTELLTPAPVSQGRWVAAQQQPNTPYIYLYDISQKSVIKLKTSIPPVVTDFLSLESLYALDHSKGKGSPGTQRGGYCMDKDGTRLWYLFRDTSGDCQLIEVEISGTMGTMSIVKKTTFSNLLPGEDINDGCSDGTHTYWCTNLVAGRIIKIKNIDHSIVDDHHFNYAIAACGAGTFDAGIPTIDFNAGTGILHWVYCRDYSFCDPPYNACRHLIQAYSDLVAIDVDTACGIGVGTPADQNMIRVCSGYTFHHRAYHPCWGYLEQIPQVDEAIQQEYLQNILGMKGGNLFTLVLLNNVNLPTYLYCIDPVEMSALSTKEVSDLTGHDPYEVDWDLTSVSAMNIQTGIIILVRYHNSEEKNYVASFKANSGLELLDDTAPIVHEGSVRFRKSISNPNALDVGNIAVQEATMSKTIQFPLFITNENAVWAAKHQLMKESYPFALISVLVNRDLFRVQVGDSFKFSYAPYGISNMICRVLLITENSLSSETIAIHAIEDFYSTSNIITTYTNPGSPPNPPTPYVLSPFIQQIVNEAPYFLTSDIEILPVAMRNSNVDLGMHVHMSIDGGNSYLLIGGAANLRPYGTLVGTYPETYTIDDTIGFTINFSNDDVDLIETITWPTVLAAINNNAILGDELITFQTITPVSGTQYKLEGIIRGRLDTEKVEHLDGESFYCIGSFNITSIQHPEIVAGADRKFKLVPYNIKGTGNLSEATVIDLSIDGRSKNPYEPTNFLANGSSFASRYSTDIILTWSPRYRGRGAGIGTPGEVLPDTDREGFFEIEVYVSDVLVRTTTAIDAATWTYTAVMNNADNGALADVVVFKLLNYRTVNGYVYESDQVIVTCKKS